MFLMKTQHIFEIIIYKFYADLKQEASHSYLGLIWWILEPIVYLGTFYTLFVLILERGGPDFAPIFLCGVVVWKWFDSGTTRYGFGRF